MEDTQTPGLESQRLMGNIQARLFGDASQVVSVGRYRIVSRLGSGAMGTVYEAFDPRLERRVAVKLLSARWHESAGSDAVNQLREEARALGRLSHPSVVTVTDVGVHDGRTFIAMELLEGGTLREWALAQPTRTPARSRRLIEFAIAAAEGLAAAHAAGFIHRDVKPANLRAIDALLVADLEVVSRARETLDEVPSAEDCEAHVLASSHGSQPNDPRLPLASIALAARDVDGASATIEDLLLDASRDQHRANEASALALRSRVHSAHESFELLHRAHESRKEELLGMLSEAD